MKSEPKFLLFTDMAGVGSWKHLDASLLGHFIYLQGLTSVATTLDSEQKIKYPK